MKSRLPDKWDKEADVVVVGFGGAGSATAITAHDAGVKVLILEKAPAGKEGGNTRVSGGSVLSHQNVADAIEYLKALNDAYVVPEDMLKTLANKTKDNGNFINSLGGEATWRSWEEFPEFPGSKNAGCWTAGARPEKGRGSDLFELYSSNVATRNIEVWYEAPGKELIQDAETNEIKGVVTVKAASKVYIKAKKAVVLTCGGFQNNQAMIRDYLRLPCGYPLGTPYNTGDGIMIALRVGADLWHMNNIAGPILNFRANELEVAFGYSPLGLLRRNCIAVGKDSKRFWNETQGDRHGKILFSGTWVPTPTPLPVHAIFDETARLGGPIYTTSAEGRGMCWYNFERNEWSQDNGAEIEKGWIIKGDTIRELATKIRRDPDVLEDTVSRYNQLCAAGEDSDFGRTTEYLLSIKTPPYYAIELLPTLVNTQGGPRRNKYAQVLDTKGKPIPRLYSAGELGSIYSHCYNGGGNLGEAMAFGRIAGENAAALEPWDEASHQ